MRSELRKAFEQKIDELEKQNKNLIAENHELTERVLDLEACK